MSTVSEQSGESCRMDLSAVLQEDELHTPSSFSACTNETSFRRPICVESGSTEESRRTVAVKRPRDEDEAEAQPLHKRTNMVTSLAMNSNEYFPRSPLGHWAGSAAAAPTTPCEELVFNRLHQEFVRKSTPIMQNLAFSLDFGSALSRGLSSSSVDWADTFALLTQSEHGIDREMAKALSDQLREKEERRHLVMRDYFGQGLQPLFSRRERTKLVDSMLHIAKRFQFELPVVFHAVALVDQYCSRVRNVNKHDLLEIGIAALMITFKLDRGNRRKFPLNAILLYCHFDDVRDREAFAKLVLQREIALFSTISLDPLGTPSMWDYLCEQLSVLSLPLPAASEQQQQHAGDERNALVSELALCLCERVLFEYDLVMGYWPSTVVCATVVCAQALAGNLKQDPQWASLLLQHTSLQTQDLLPCLLHMQRMLREESLSYAMVYAKKTLRESRQQDAQGHAVASETDSELPSFFDYEEFLALVERETNTTTMTTTTSAAAPSSSSSSLSPSSATENTDRRAYLASLPALLAVVSDATALVDLEDKARETTRTDCGSSRCTTTDSIPVFSPDRSVSSATSSSSSSTAMNHSMAAALRGGESEKKMMNTTAATPILRPLQSSFSSPEKLVRTPLLAMRDDHARERLQWRSLSRALSHTIESVDEEEREPLKSVRLRHRGVYSRLVFCPPLY